MGFKAQTEGPTDLKQQRLAHLTGSTSANTRPTPNAPGSETEELVRGTNGNARIAPEVDASIKASQPARPQATAAPAQAAAKPESFWDIVRDTFKDPGGRLGQSFKNIDTLVKEGRYATPQENADARRIGSMFNAPLQLAVPGLGIAGGIASTVDVAQRSAKGEKVDPGALSDALPLLRGGSSGRTGSGSAETASRASGSSGTASSATGASGSAQPSFRPPTRLADGRIGYPLSPTRGPKLPEESTSSRPAETGAASGTETGAGAAAGVAGTSTAPDPTQLGKRPGSPSTLGTDVSASKAPALGETSPEPRPSTSGEGKRPASPSTFGTDVSASKAPALGETSPEPRAGTSAEGRRPASPSTLGVDVSGSRTPIPGESSPESSPGRASERESALRTGESSAAAERSGQREASAGPSREMAAVLSPQQWSSPADRFVSPQRGDEVGAYRDRYQQAFSGLTAEERYAVRDWTYAGGTGMYVDNIRGKPVLDTNEYAGTNYDLNSYLRGDMGRRTNPYYEAASSRLHNALSKLPQVPMDNAPLLRVADVGRDYASKFTVGDHVTNGRPFMSASSNNRYAAESLQQGYAAEGRTGGMAIYELNSKSAVPTLPGITTQAAHEAEWLFQPNSVFKVTEMGGTRAATQADPNLSVTGMRMDEVNVTQPISAKGLHTGRPTTIRPEDQRPPPLPDPYIPPPSFVEMSSGSGSSAGSSPRSRSGSPRRSD